MLDAQLRNIERQGRAAVLRVRWCMHSIPAPIVLVGDKTGEEGRHPSGEANGAIPCDVD